MAGQTDTQLRHSIQVLSGLIASISDFVGIFEESDDFREVMVSSVGTRSTTRSFFTDKFRGSIVMLSWASSMQASTGSPFTRTAQLPHCPDPQLYLNAKVGSSRS